MFVVLRHTGSYSDYRCELIGVFTSLEEANAGVEGLLFEQIEESKRRIQRSIDSLADDQSSYNCESLERHQRELRALNEKTYDLTEEKKTFQILEVDLNKWREFTPKDYDLSQRGPRTIVVERNDMLIDEHFFFESNIYKKVHSEAESEEAESKEADD